MNELTMTWQEVAEVLGCDPPDNLAARKVVLRAEQRGLRRVAGRKRAVFLREVVLAWLRAQSGVVAAPAAKRARPTRRPAPSTSSSGAPVRELLEQLRRQKRPA